MKIVYITGTRADFGLMLPVLNAINRSSNLELLVFATGMHLMKKHGLTLKSVQQSFPQTQIVSAIFSSGSATGMAEFSGHFLPALIAMLHKNQPDLVLLLGDRAEMLLTAVACLYLRIPVAHVHGGERTMTADELARHAITKLSNLHFVATKDGADRIAKLGEDPTRIHVVGAPAFDTIYQSKLPTTQEVYAAIDLPLHQSFILLTLHPVVINNLSAKKQFEIVLTAIKKFDLPVIIIYPNADTGGKEIIAEIEKLKKNPMIKSYPNLDFQLFLGLQREACVWVGNSSAGLIESAAFKVPVINVGHRQNKRLRDKNVIDVNYDSQQISQAIAKAVSQKRRKQLQKKSIWGDGHASQRIVKILTKIKNPTDLLTKQLTY